MPPLNRFGRRDETESERLDRNWVEIIQELRVTQILTGFLLTIPFQQRFTEFSDYQLAIYLALVAVAVTLSGTTRRRGRVVPKRPAMDGCALARAPPRQEPRRPQPRRLIGTG